ncbi:MAG: 5-formyltetrahydrofolate cyclo-ligase [Candidatus Cloacimonadota bacterium]|nr:MAG: 5-formyltetrahydrofolate cyclo-ligase [Candidatus Cloacimonadota bacterium]PIE77592.1 MAG: 5-formyltetrahydrofolate cyclo-ligase [Candidatus Delongbacteria bacterium]
MCDIRKKKKDLRKKIKKLKKDITDQKREVLSNSLMEKIENLDQFKKSKTIFIFWSMDDEVDTRGFIKKHLGKKRFILPSIKGNDLILKPLDSLDQLIDGEQFNIPEPNSEPLKNLDAIDLAIIPGVAFDIKGNRMGRGRGFYDRILNLLPKTTEKIGICYQCQIVEDLPVESFDIPMDTVIYS